MLNYYKKKTKVGVSWYIGIPKKLADMLEENKEYAITINEHDIKPITKVEDITPTIDNIDLIESKNI